jgi:hypothetical protein
MLWVWTHVRFCERRGGQRCKGWRGKGGAAQDCVRGCKTHAMLALIHLLDGKATPAKLSLHFQAFQAENYLGKK